jgi:hypothetical protein
MLSFFRLYSDYLKQRRKIKTMLSGLWDVQPIRQTKKGYRWRAF